MHSGWVRILATTASLPEVDGLSFEDMTNIAFSNSFCSIKKETGTQPAFRARSITFGLSAIKIPFSGSCFLKRSFSESLAKISSSVAEKSAIWIMFNIKGLLKIVGLIITYFIKKEKSYGIVEIMSL